MGSLPSLNDILYRTGQFARRATTIGGDPEAVASVRAGERLMEQEDAGRAMGQNPAYRGLAGRALDAATAGYGGEELPAGGDIELPMAPQPRPRSDDAYHEPPVSRSMIAAHAERIGAPRPTPEPGPEPMAQPFMDSRIGRAAFTPRGVVPNSIQAGAAKLREGEWTGVGGGLRSAAQMEQDLRAHDLLNRGYRQSIDQAGLEDAVRGNPTDLAINARKRDLGYEDLLPANADSHLRFGRGDNDAGLMDYADQRAPEIGMPTMGEYRQNRSLIAQAAAKQDPKNIAEGATTMGRGRIAEELSLLREKLDGKLRAAKNTPMEKDVAAEVAASWAKATDTARILSEILKSGYPPTNPLAGP